MFFAMERPRQNLNLELSGPRQHELVFEKLGGTLEVSSREIQKGEWIV